MVSIGASGFMGIAIESTPNEYEAPTKFFPIRNENLVWTQDTNWRRVIRGTVDIIGAAAGNGNAEGDVDMELLDDVLPYWLIASRGEMVKTGAAPTFTYTFTPTHDATPTSTLSITVVRAGIAFGYVGCVVGNHSFGSDNDLATYTPTVVGTSEEEVAVPAAPVYRDDDDPFGSGMWNIQVPTGTQIFDADNYTLDINDNAEAQNRLKNSLGAQFVSFGERDVELTVDRDFEDRSEYNEFKLLTEKSISVRLEKEAGRAVQFNIPGSIKDTYEVSLTGVGDLVRASTTYRGIHAASVGGGFEIVVETDEDITV